MQSLIVVVVALAAYQFSSRLCQILLHCIGCEILSCWPLYYRPSAVHVYTCARQHADVADCWCKMTPGKTPTVVRKGLRNDWDAILHSSRNCTTGYSAYCRLPPGGSVQQQSGQGQQPAALQPQCCSLLVLGTSEHGTAPRHHGLTTGSCLGKHWYSTSARIRPGRSFTSPDWARQVQLKIWRHIQHGLSDSRLSELLYRIKGINIKMVIFSRIGACD